RSWSSTRWRWRSRAGGRRPEWSTTRTGDRKVDSSGRRNTSMVEVSGGDDAGAAAGGSAVSGAGAVAGAADGGVARGPGAVLGGGRLWAEDRGCGEGGW